jgi:hypothetical protein
VTVRSLLLDPSCHVPPKGLSQKMVLGDEKAEGAKKAHVMRTSFKTSESAYLQRH